MHVQAPCEFEMDGYVDDLEETPALTWGGGTIIVLLLYHHCIETSSWEYNRLKWLGGRPVISGPSTDTAFPLSAQPRSFVHQPAF